jgi:hypothetical protein
MRATDHDPHLNAEPELPAIRFTGASLALTQAGIDSAAQMLRTGAAEIRAVFAVETSGCGFLPDRRPPILYERHIFHRLTHGVFDDGDLSSPDPGGYGPPGAQQYERLLRAVALNRSAALQSASWGMAQIMGENFRAAGFASIEDMVAAMCGSEDAQLRAFVAFLGANRLDLPLRARDWTALARGYNGPNFAVNQYDVKLGAAFVRLSAGPQPDLGIRAAQLYLSYRGSYPSGAIDGIAGNRTRAAVQGFQRVAGLPVTGNANPATLAALLPAVADPASRLA